MTKEELFALMEQIAEEREAARPVVEKLVSGEEPIDDIEIPEGWRTAGMVLELCERADPIGDVDPVRGLALLQVALLVSTDLRYSRLASSWLSGQVWAEIGYAQTVQCWYTAAFRALETADRFIADEPALLFYGAKVNLRRAAALALEHRRADAVRLSDEAQELFSQFGDDRRVLSSRLAKAMARSEVGDFREARIDYEALIPEAEALRYTDFLLRLHNNLGVACRELGDFPAAIFHFERARKLSAETGHAVAVRKVDWGLARTLLAQGRFTEAEATLRKLRREFAVHEIVEDAGLVALDLVEILVATNRVAEAFVLTEAVITEFRNANLNHQVLMAVGYLRDLLSTTQPAREAVKHVRAYVEKLKNEPALLFLPLEN